MFLRRCWCLLSVFIAFFESPSKPTDRSAIVVLMKSQAAVKGEASGMKGSHARNQSEMSSSKRLGIQREIDMELTSN